MPNSWYIYYLWWFWCHWVRVNRNAATIQWPVHLWGKHPSRLGNPIPKPCNSCEERYRDRSPLVSTCPASDIEWRLVHQLRQGWPLSQWSVPFFHNNILFSFLGHMNGIWVLNYCSCFFYESYHVTKSRKCVPFAWWCLDIFFNQQAWIVHGKPVYLFYLGVPSWAIFSGKASRNITLEHLNLGRSWGGLCQNYNCQWILGFYFKLQNFMEH